MTYVVGPFRVRQPLLLTSLQSEIATPQQDDEEYFDHFGPNRTSWAHVRTVPEVEILSGRTTPSVIPCFAGLTSTLQSEVMIPVTVPLVGLLERLAIHDCILDCDFEESAEWQGHPVL